MDNWLWIYILFLFFNSNHSAIFLYDTDNRRETQIYDCLYYDGSGFDEYINPSTTQAVQYCIRLDEMTSIQRTYSHGCFNEGVLLSFEQIKALNIPTKELLAWNVPISVIDHYQAYLELNEVMTNFICNCTKPRTFGILCEYQFSHETFEETIQYQFQLKKDHKLGSQLYGNTTCYNPSFHCDSGMRCLDWRHICDYKQQCVDGTDEEYCEHLLFHECDTETEYRCRNGMCIDKEYFLDGDIDCQDRSDEEIYIFDRYARYCSFTPNLECDERLPYSKTHFSCGDGEMMIEHALSIPILFVHYCKSFRERQWMCEFDSRYKMWTNPENGHCLDIAENFTDLKEPNDCIFIVKCALMSRNQPKSCPCSGNECRSYFLSLCGSENMLFYNYPKGRVRTSFVETFYNLETHNFTSDDSPDYYVFTRSVKCTTEIRAIPDQTYIKTNIDMDMTYSFFMVPWQPYESILCNMYRKKNPQIQIGAHCWNETYPNRAVFCQPGESFDCVSKQQINDGVFDCAEDNDETTLISMTNCSAVRKHRYQCLKRNSSCFTVLNLEKNGFECSSPYIIENKYETKPELKEKQCKNKRSSDCEFIRQFIEQSSEKQNLTNVSSINNLIKRNGIKENKFWSYCDSIWDLDYGVDELNCSEWRCHPDYLYYQCRTGQCIPFDWLCNGKWDCSDGSDEEAFALLTEATLSEYNLKIFQQNKKKFSEIQDLCFEQMSNRSFKTICDYRYEYPCLLANVENPLNLELNRPCINLTKIGDGQIDCYGGFDERNLLNCSARTQLGFNFKCNHSDVCKPVFQRCFTQNQCQKNENRILCFHLPNQTNWTSSYDLIQAISENGSLNFNCLNGSFKSTAKCNGRTECEFGEDELFCDDEVFGILVSTYRQHAMNVSGIIFQIQLANYLPSSSSSLVFNGTNREKKSNDSITEKSKIFVQDTRNDLLTVQEKARQYSKEGWICNRGVLAWKSWSNNSQVRVQCFCPPSYYGQWCQWMSNRITIFTHFQDQTGDLKEGVIKILATFISTTNQRIQILDHHEFHFTPELADLDRKHKFYFVYPQSYQLRTNTPSYTVRFEAYLLTENNTIEFLSVWIYPIVFDFLPAQRLAKVLKYTRQSFLVSNHICSSHENPCSIHGGKCHPLMNKLNDTQEYWCQCPSDSYGFHCQFKDDSCAKSICSRTSQCRPKYAQQGEKPFCLCSINTYGSTCHLKHQCQMKANQNSCLNNGKCFTNYQPHSLMNDSICQCLKNYFGSKCEQHSAIIQIFFPDQTNNSSNETILATVIQLFDINNEQDLLFRKQKVFQGILPVYSQIIYTNYLLPLFGLIRLYSNTSIIHHYLLYTTTNNEQSFNLTLSLTKQNYCPHTFDIFNQTNNHSNIVARYPSLCRNISTFELRCFHDDDYFCLCDLNKFTQCFRFNQAWDQCQHCLFEGQCLGDEQMTGEYVCLCPRCYYGERCQSSTQALSFTIESLISPDILAESLKKQVSMILYILLPILLLLYSCVNNLFSFITFRRPKPLSIGTGHYLLLSTITSQFSIVCFVTKIIYVIFGIQGYLSESIFNLIFCKLITYFLSSSTRIYYWLTALVTIERVYVAKYPKRTWLKQPKIAKRIILFIYLLTFGSHTHELVKYTIITESKHMINGTSCVSQYDRNLKSYDRTITFIHYLIPFAINFFCTIYLTILIVRSRASVDKKRTRYEILSEHCRKQKEIFLPSIMIILSALPQLIISFLLACTDLEKRWERYLLTTAYFLSYVPQILTFHLYVQPSTFLLNEFYATKMGSTFKRTMNADRKARK